MARHGSSRSANRPEHDPGISFFRFILEPASRGLNEPDGSAEIERSKDYHYYLVSTVTSARNLCFSPSYYGRRGSATRPFTFSPEERG